MQIEPDTFKSIVGHAIDCWIGQPHANIVPVILLGWQPHNSHVIDDAEETQQFGDTDRLYIALLGLDVLVGILGHLLK